MSRILESMLDGVKSVAILGHIRPDGDCLGSTLGLYNYLGNKYPGIHARVYLEEAAEKFAYLKGFDEIRHEPDDRVYDLPGQRGYGTFGKIFLLF